MRQMTMDEARERRAALWADLDKAIKAVAALKNAEQIGPISFNTLVRCRIADLNRLV